MEISEITKTKVIINDCGHLSEHESDGIMPLPELTEFITTNIDGVEPSYSRLEVLHNGINLTAFSKDSQVCLFITVLYQ